MLGLLCDRNALPPELFFYCPRRIAGFYILRRESVARPRKSGDRYPSGKLKPQPLRHRRDLTHESGRGAGLRRLRIDRIIDDSQLAAGAFFARIVGARDRLAGAPNKKIQNEYYRWGLAKVLTEDDRRWVCAKYAAAKLALSPIEWNALCEAALLENYVDYAAQKTVRGALDKLAPLLPSRA
jgi:hypothetical protein